jgi:hypothetical protein
MRMSAPKLERKRLDRSMQKCADQTVSRVVPAAETRNRTQLARQLHRRRHKASKRLDLRAIRRQNYREGVLLGECRLNCFKQDASFLECVVTDIPQVAGILAQFLLEVAIL